MCPICNIPNLLDNYPTCNTPYLLRIYPKCDHSLTQRTELLCEIKPREVQLNLPEDVSLFVHHGVTDDINSKIWSLLKIMGMIALLYSIVSTHWLV